MTIALGLPFGSRRLVLSLCLAPALGTHPRPRPVVDDPVAYGATDAELARLNARSTAVVERLHWEARAVLHRARLR
jgi:hypothetical protein